jgi:hypothetical protein
MKWARYVVRKGEMRNAYKILVGKPERKRPLGRPRHRERIILTWISKKFSVRASTKFILMTGTSGSYKHGNETSVFLNGRGSFGQLSFLNTRLVH